MSLRTTLSKAFVATLLGNASLLLFSTLANAGYSVPYGCAAPSTTYQHAWYVDPVNGTDAGNGSQAKPWKTLQNVFAAGLVGFQTHNLAHYSYPLIPAPKTAVVQPGDVIWLASGNHGAILLKNAINSDFITIKAMPGATPTFSTFTVMGASHWVIDGITVEATKPNANVNQNSYLLYVSSNAYWGTLDNIILNGNTIMSQSDTTSWAPSDWRNSVSNGIWLAAGMPLVINGQTQTDYNGVNDGQCFAITNNNISNIGFGIDASLADKVVISNNTINRFADDGIDFSVSDAMITENKITNSIDDGDGMHRDGMQGQPYWGEQTYNHNLSFAYNIVIAQTDPNLKYAACLQGIDTFDGIWKDIDAYDNLIISNAYQGLIFTGVQGANIINNTVLSSSNPTTCSLQSGALTGSEPQSAGPNSDAMLVGGGLWIGTHDAKDGTVSTGVIMRNNIASTYSMSATGTTVFDHNIVAGTNTKLWLPMPAGATPPKFASTPSLFVNYDPATFGYDVHLKAGSPAIGFGLTTGAPNIDIYGTARVAPIDAGAVAATTKDSAVLGGTLK